MSKYKYFVFDYHTNKLGCLDLLGNADDSDFIEVLDTHSFRFYFNQKYFDNLNEFLDYLKHLNFKVAEAYIEDKPPYEIRQLYYDAAAPLWFRQRVGLSVVNRQRFQMTIFICLLLMISLG